MATDYNAVFKAQENLETEKYDVVVAGSVAIDLSCNYLPNKNSVTTEPQPQTSNRAEINQTVGGVGHNVATTTSYLRTSTLLCSYVGDDLAGQRVLAYLSDKGLSTSGIRVLEGKGRTAQYVAVNNANNDLILAMADMDIFESGRAQLDERLTQHVKELPPKWLVVDANWAPKILHKWIQLGRDADAKIAFEPVSTTKAKRLFAASPSTLTLFPNALVDLATPNAMELASMFEAASAAGHLDHPDWFRVIDAFGLPQSGSRQRLVSLTSPTMVDQGTPQQTLQLLPYIPCILTTLGSNGVLVTELLRRDDARLTSPDFAAHILGRSTSEQGDVGGIYMRLFPPVQEVSREEISSVNGVGDTFLGAIIAGLCRGRATTVSDWINFAQTCSIKTLRSTEAVDPTLATMDMPLSKS